jgi:predicted sulfurtransferase
MTSSAEGVEGVLLYYKYVDLRDRRDEVKRWFEELCARLRLVGRVRVALDGINVTVGGSVEALQEHVCAVQQRFGTDIDFKLQRSARGSRSGLATAQSGFDSLRVQLCQEVVSMGAAWPTSTAAAAPGSSEGGGGDAAPAPARHVSPHEWHAMLAEAAAGQGGEPSGRETVLLDARNAYEIRIGRFEAVSSQKGGGAHPAGPPAG